MNINLKQLDERQDKILNFIDKSDQASISQILDDFLGAQKQISRITLNRDLKKLLELDLIARKGSGRSVVYELSAHYNLLKPIDAEKYFKQEFDKRTIHEKFNFDIFNDMSEVFSNDEAGYLDKLNQAYLKNKSKLSFALLKKEFERLTIELSWKSSQIEGNTYTLLETEELIKENIPVVGHTEDEATMILNHKKTLDYIRNNVEEFKNISIAKIENIHFLLIQDLKIKRNLRKRVVRITGTNYMPLDNEFQIKEALDRACKLINKEENLFVKALVLMLLIAYIQPFEDGNKRTSRLMGNAVLLAHDICPLSYRSVKDSEYKKAVLLFYEQNNISYFKQLFIEQFKFAVNNYFGA